jgi:hypothetical protein
MKKTKQQTPGRYLDEREQQMEDDYEWCLHDPEVRKAYGGRVVVAYQRKIWGAGRDHAAAWTAARRKRGCPPRGHAAIVFVPPNIRLLEIAYRRMAREKTREAEALEWVEPTAGDVADLGLTS